MTSPRVASTSGVRTSVTASSVSAFLISLSKVTIEEIVAFWLLGKMVTSWPCEKVPRRTVPDTPRKLSARAIIWMRMSPLADGSLAFCQLWIASCSVCPEYQGICVLGYTTLSPASALSGMIWMSLTSRRATARWISAEISSKTSCL